MLDREVECTASSPVVWIYGIPLAAARAQTSQPISGAPAASYRFSNRSSHPNICE